MIKLMLAMVVVAVVVLGTALLAYLKPPRFRVRRSVVINATSDSVSALIRNVDRWPEWSPPEDATGEVHLQLVASTPQSVRVQADWKRPFVARNFNEFEFAPTDRGVQVTWTLDGQNVTMLRVMTVFVTPDRVMGRHLANGLAGLKAVAERSR